MITDVTLESFNTFVSRLAKFDWHYEFSDDRSTWKAGQNTRDSLRFSANEHPFYGRAYTTWWSFVFDTKRTAADVHERDCILNEIRTELLITA